MSIMKVGNQLGLYQPTGITLTNKPEKSHLIFVNQNLIPINALDLRKKVRSTGNVSLNWLLLLKRSHRSPTISVLRSV
jgi:hypothetical protein